MVSSIRSSCLVALVCLIVLASTAVVWAQEGYEGGYERFGDRVGNPIDRINDALNRFGRIFLWIGVGVLALLAVRLVGPSRVYYGAEERLLKRAVRDVADLLTRIQEAQAPNEASKEAEAPANHGLLAGMAEVAEFDQAEQVPSYVFTVNDLTLDGIAVTLKRLRRFDDSTAERYRDYLFSVVKGIKTITEESAESGTSSGLAVDVKEYFQDERRYRVWRKALSRAARKGGHQEIAGTFLTFMRAVREGKPLVPSRPAPVAAEAAKVSAKPQSPEIPTRLNEETLSLVQEAAAREAGDLCSLIRTGRSSGETAAWQFEFVRRQQQVHHRDEAQRMLSVFLNGERKALLQLAKIRMLPCRTWDHVLHMLGVDGSDRLEQRIDNRLLTLQEIIILEKAFLQTFAKKASLARIYGQGEQAGLMLDMHIPEIRRQTLSLLQRLHRLQPRQLDEATEALNEEETPQNGQVAKLIRHYVHQGHSPPGGGRG